jgi:hypothetical protein
MSNQAGSEGAAYSIADLAADAAAVQRALHLDEPVVTLPDQRTVELPDGVITERALAQVAGLDSYGD